MKPIPIETLLGPKRASIRSRLNEFIEELVREEVCFDRIEAIRAVNQEMQCLEAEERGRILLNRQWDPSVGLGILADTANRQLNTFQVNHDMFYDEEDSLSGIKHEDREQIGGDGDISAGIPERHNGVTPTLASASGGATTDLAVDSPRTHPPTRQGNEASEILSMASAYDIYQFYDEQEELLNRPTIHHNEDDDANEEDDEEDLDEEDEDEDDDDEDDDEDEEDKDADPKSRVDYTLRASEPGVGDGRAGTVFSISFSTCSNHIWDPILYEDVVEKEEEEQEEENDSAMAEPDFYRRLESAGTGGVYGNMSQAEEYDDVRKNILLWALKGRPPKKGKRVKQFLIIEDECECVSCGTKHAFRLRINWPALYRLASLLQKALGDTDIAPPVIHRHNHVITDKSDAMFPFVRAMRILAFVLIMTGGTSGYVIAPVDFFTSLVSSGIPILSGKRLRELIFDYESDESIDVD